MPKASQLMTDGLITRILLLKCEQASKFPLTGVNVLVIHGVIAGDSCHCSKKLNNKKGSFHILLRQKK